MAEQPQTGGRPGGRRAALSILTIVLLTGLMFYLFRDNMDDITSAISNVSAWQLLLLIALGLSTPLLDSVICQRILNSRMPGVTMRQGAETIFLGTFANVVTFGAGTLPIRGYYFYREGLNVGPGLGLITLQYVFHKGTLLVYALVLLAFQWGWLTQNTSGLFAYMPYACIAVAAIILGLVLVCTWRPIQNIVRRAMKLLPKTEKWQKRRADWTEQLDLLATESRLLLKDRRLCLQVVGLEVLKLFLLYSIPWLGLHFMHLEPPGFVQAQTLAALMMLLSNALPNLAGMGSIETAFLLVFQGFLPESSAMSALVLYRIATYYIPFIVSCISFFLLQRRWSRTEG